MSAVDHLVHENERYVRTFPGPRPLRPKLRLAVLACMDSRLDLFGALGLDVGDAHLIRNAGGLPTDDTLRSLYIDRIYDTYIDEEQLQDCDHTIGLIADSLEPRPYSSREFIKEMGKWLADGNAKKTNSLVQAAYEARQTKG